MFATLILVVLLMTGSANIFRIDHTGDPIIRESVNDCKPEGLTKQHSISTLHSPLIIESNSEFETNGWLGEGTEENPYRMEGIKIVNESVVVSISNTDAYFIIRDSNLTFTGLRGSCVSFDNVMNGAIENCTIVSSFKGIEMNNSQTCKVLSNIIGPCVALGIHLSSSSHMLVSHNEIMDITYRGTYVGSYDACIALYRTDDTTISENIVGNAPHIISIAYSDRVEILSNNISNPTMYDALLTVSTNECVIRDNIITSSARGMNLNHDSSCLIENNTVTVYDVWAIMVRGGYDFVVKGNNVSGNLRGYDFQGLNKFVVTNNIVHHSEFGLILNDYFIDSEVSNNTAYACDFGFFIQGSIPNATLVGCTAYNNDRGFYIQSASECGFYGCIAYENNIGFELAHSGQFELIGNIAYNNTLYGISIWNGCFNNTLYHNSIFNNGVRDNGVTNTWDDGIDQGNFWDDYSGVGYYDVPGTAGSQDRYPGIYPSSYPMPVMLDAQTVMYEYSTTGNTITWQVLSVGVPDYFEVYQEDVLIASEVWDGIDVVYPVDGLEMGLHNFTLIVFDWFGNSGISFGKVNVTEFTGSTVTTTTITTTNTTTNGTIFDISLITMIISISSGSVIVIVVIVIFVKQRP